MSILIQRSLFGSARYGLHVYGGRYTEATLEQDLLDYFADSPAPITLIEDRCYYGRAKQDPTAPYMTFVLVSQDTIKTHAGKNSVTVKSFQFSVFARRQDQAAIVADALYDILEGFQGTFGTVQVGSVFLEDRREFYEEDTELHSQVMTFTFHYTA